MAAMIMGQMQAPATIIMSRRLVAWYTRLSHSAFWRRGEMSTLLIWASMSMVMFLDETYVYVVCSGIVFVIRYELT